MPNLNPRFARTYNGAPVSWRYDPQTNILWLKLTDGTDTAWFPIHLGPQFPQSVDHTGAA